MGSQTVAAPRGVGGEDQGADGVAAAPRRAFAEAGRREEVHGPAVFADRRCAGDAGAERLEHRQAARLEVERQRQRHGVARCAVDGDHVVAEVDEPGGEQSRSQSRLPAAPGAGQNDGLFAVADPGAMDGDQVVAFAAQTDQLTVQSEDHPGQGAARDQAVRPTPQAIAALG